MALIQSALNAITGTARSLRQMSRDGQFPKFFQHLNSHGVPDRSMVFNVVCSIVVVFFGGAVQIYTFSNVGYLASFVPVLVGYYLPRRDRPNVRRPFKLPEWMKYLALALAAFYTFIYFYGGITYASCACNAAGRKTLAYYFIGFAVLAAYLPLYWWRKRDDVKTGSGAPMTIGQHAAAAAAAAGGEASPEPCAGAEPVPGASAAGDLGYAASGRGPGNPGHGGRPRDAAHPPRVARRSTPKRMSVGHESEFDLRVLICRDF